MSDDIYTKRVISHDEAHECLSRLVASHFHNPNKEHARASIPANPDRDDDLLMGAFIEQQRVLHSDNAKLRDALKPFAEMAKIYDYMGEVLSVDQDGQYVGGGITIGQGRRAKSLLGDGQ